MVQYKSTGCGVILNPAPFLLGMFPGTPFMNFGGLKLRKKITQNRPMAKRSYCHHLKDCQLCQDAIDAGVDAMLEDLLGPAGSGGDTDMEGAEDSHEDSQEEEDASEEAEDSQPSDPSQSRGKDETSSSASLTRPSSKTSSSRRSRGPSRE